MPTPPRRPQTPAGTRTHAPVGHGAKTAAVRDQAILALLSEPTIAQAAARCGVDEKTLRRWLAEEAFTAAYEAARKTTFRAAISRIPALTVRAVETLADLLGTSKPPAVRLGGGADRGRDRDAPVRRRDDPEEIGRSRSQSTEEVIDARFVATHSDSRRPTGGGGGV